MSPATRVSGGEKLVGLARVALGLMVLFVPLVGLQPASGEAPSNGGLVSAVHVLAADDGIYRMAAEGGYESIVQVFPWRDIEPTRDEWHWEQPDFVVRAADYYGMGLILRLDHPPDWALEREQDGGEPTINLEAYAGFVTAVARRYRGQVQGYVIWNEPNLSREWGARPPDAAAYTALLCRAYDALKAVDPAATVVSAGLAPTNGGDGAVDDRQFLRDMYESGAAACLDALGAHGYGFGHPPDDPRGAHDGLNLARLMDLHEIMAAHGASGIPVWITELGWTTDGVGSHSWQTVSLQQQSDYLTGAWQYIGSTWPWVQVATVWNLSSGLSPVDEMAGYSLLQQDGSPKPAYEALADLLAGQSGSGHQGWVERLAAAWRRPQEAEVSILAAEEIVHVGDDQ
jgi:GH35 family endo-1,4-beta-xylanase